MSRRPDPERKSKRAAKPGDDEDLPMLEAIADELEQVAGADQVQVTCKAAGEPGFDTAITVAAPAMDKQAMVVAVGAALRRSATASAALVRNHRVVVGFLGDTIIGSAVKDAIGEILKQHKARKIVVRRGYGDELLHEGAAPRVVVDKRMVGDTMRVEVATGDLEAADLPAAMQQELVALVSGARGHRFLFSFQGAARPDAAMRELLSRTLGDAGAVRAAVGERVLFDRELEARVRVTPRGDDVGIEVTPADTEAETQDALSMVLPPATDRLAGKIVHLQFQRPPRPQELAHAMALCQQAAPRRFEVTTAAGVDVVLPRLLEVETKGEDVRLRVVVGGRDPAGTAVAFRREGKELAETLADVAGKTVTVDWVEAAAIGAAVQDECLQLAIERLQPKALSRSSDGGEPEPVWPAPFVLGSDGAVRTLRIDTDAGKPAQLLVAIERRLAPALASWRGTTGRLRFVGATARGRLRLGGATAPSRTLLRTLIGMLETAGVQRLEVQDHGAIDLVLPPLLRIGGGGVRGEPVRLAANPAGRDAAQIDAALQRELAGMAWDGASVAVAVSPLAERLVAAAVERGAACVLLDGDEPVQVHPRLLTAQRQGDRLDLRADPGVDAAMVQRQLGRELPPLLDTAGDLDPVTVAITWRGATEAPPTGSAAALLAAVIARAPARVTFDDGQGERQVHPEIVRTYVSVLGRKDDGESPLLMLGLDVGDAEDHEQHVLDALQRHADLLPGRRVLLVLRAADGDRAAGDGDQLVSAVRRVVDPVAKATLVFRGNDRRGRAYFTVAHTNVEGLAVGAAFADPRRSS